MGLMGKTAIVTGGAMGLGKAFAKRLAADGANIVIADLRNAEDAAAEIGAPGGRAIGVATDITREEDVALLTEAAMRAFGRIDILVNNAAYFARTKEGRFEDIGLDEWQRMLNVNIIGTYLCCRAAVPHMKQQGGGRIIVVSSGTAIKGAAGHIHYATSKAGLIGFTRSLARELGKDGITVNAVAPGLTLSDGVIARGVTSAQQLESQRKSRAIPRDEHPEDLVGAVSFLASGDSAFMTGQTLVVDGGSVMV
ncbi:MAG: dehydrogenase [Gammaproteobacteria bacterium RIFCSPLOWO2_02_FULL_61_13]|nr:MAG: dehydrogenase [Gammaproteobacteria bacterium RIFCSPLOWO2_02_FULL_61_13]